MTATAAAAVAVATSPRGKIPRIVSIQYLRAIAALAVVAFHALEATPYKFAVGAAGVDVFFVISGFIMWTLTEGAESRPKTFLWRRFVRVTPTYWIATLLVVAVALVRPHFLWMPPIAWDRVAQSLLFIPHRDGWGQPYPVLIQGWTLNYEMFFYLVFGLVLLAPRRFQLQLISGLFAALAVAGLLLRPSDPAGATYTSLLLLEFIAGAWIGRIWLTGRLSGAGLGAVLALGGLAAFAVEQAMGFKEGPYRALYWGLPAILLVVGALMLEGAGRIGSWRVPLMIGDGSYSIYLFHLFVVAATARVLGRAPIALQVVGAMIASAALGVLLFYLLEKPINTWFRKIGGRKPAPAPAAQPPVNGLSRPGVS